MTLTQQVARDIITKLLNGEDYRVEIIALINASFLDFAIDFFKKIVDAKIKNNDITGEWYKREFLSPSLPKRDIAINSGLNMKTISNMFNSGTKEVVIDASNEHYDQLYETIAELAQSNADLDLTLTIKFNKVSVDLNINESLMVINTLAVKRAALRGGLWSTAGKRVEKPLMQTLCHLYQVPENNYSIQFKGKTSSSEDFIREVDFYLKGENDDGYKCEVKLMGKGNPESADAVIARDSKVFIADKLSDTNKKQLNSLKVQWVELRNKEGFRRFEEVLKALKIPHKTLDKNYNQKLNSIFDTIFKKDS